MTSAKSPLICLTLEELKVCDFLDHAISRFHLALEISQFKSIRTTY